MEANNLKKTEQKVGTNYLFYLGSFITVVAFIYREKLCYNARNHTKLIKYNISIFTPKNGELTNIDSNSFFQHKLAEAIDSIEKTTLFAQVTGALTAVAYFSGDQYIANQFCNLTGLCNSDDNSHS